MAAKAAAIEARHRDDSWLAWHIARLGQVDPKKFPSLKRFMGPPSTAESVAAKKPTPWQVQFEAAKQWDKRVNQKR